MGFSIVLRQYIKNLIVSVRYIFNITLYLIIEYQVILLVSHNIIHQIMVNSDLLEYIVLNLLIDE